MTARRDELPELSLIVPCFNEQETIGYTIPQLVRAFERAGHRLELVACDNGSTDRTGDMIRRFADAALPVVYHRVSPNEGYGNGVLQSIPVCRAPWIGIIPADGQVDAEDAARLFEIVKHTDGRVIGKVRRRQRMDGPLRRVVSLAYNALVWALWPSLGSLDVNGSPKIVRRDVLDAMELESRRWFLDAEMMIKAHELGVRVVEMNVFSRVRSHGISHLRARTLLPTCGEFLGQLLRYRFGDGLSAWRAGRREVRRPLGATGDTLAR